MFDMAKLGKNISSRRKALGMTQMELADRLGISYQAVSNWERGNTSPDISNLGELAEILDCSVDELLGSRRTAEVLKQVEDEVEHPDITPEELADVAPILKPQQVDKTFSAVFADLGELISDRVAEAMGKVKDMQERLQNEHITDKINERVNAAMQRAGRKLESFDPSRVKIVRHERDDNGDLHVELHVDKPRRSHSHSEFDGFLSVAPFMSEEAISETLLNMAESGDITAEMLASIAPFADEYALSQAAYLLFENGSSAKELAAVAPFIDGDVLGRIAVEAAERGDDFSDITAVIPFIDDGDIAKICRVHLENGGSIDDLNNLADMLHTDDIGNLCIQALDNGEELSSVSRFFPMLTEDWADKIYRHAAGRDGDDDKPNRPKGPGFPFGKPWSRK